MESVIVIGGGASGLMAALTAAEKHDRRVILLERQQRVGRKLLATGNGRCNLSNTGAAPAHYHGQDPDFTLPALAAFSPEDALDFFQGLGLLTVTEYGGRVYPLSNSANSVLDVLRFALETVGVELHSACPARAIRPRLGGFVVETEQGSFSADRLIMACGGAAGGKLGGVTDGYELMKALGHRRTGLYPSLAPVYTDPEYPRALKGVRAPGALRLNRGEELLAESRGEIQFTENGLSGPAVFDLSRAAATGGEGLTVHMDLLPLEQADLLAMLRRRQALTPEREAAELFTGMLHNRLGRMLVRYSGVSGGATLGELSEEELLRCARAAKDFALRVRGVGSLDSAQVTAGGLRTEDFNSQTLESRLCPGLFACGEVLDVDGDCGGYNLQWAWASGRLAGRLGT